MNDTIPSVCVKGSILEKIIKNRVKSVFISIALAILLSWIVLREIYPGGVDIYNAVIEENVAKIERYVAHKGRLDLSGLLTGVTPLCYALVHDKPESFKALLENGASPNAFSRDGFSAVHLAARNDNPYWINACLQHGADLHLLTSRGAIRGSRVTPFGYASYYDQFNNVSIMAKSGMDMNAPVDEHGNNAFVFSLRIGRLEIAMQLVRLGVEPMSAMPYEDMVSYFGSRAFLKTDKGFIMMYQWYRDNGYDVNEIFNGTMWGDGYLLERLDEINSIEVVL